MTSGASASDQLPPERAGQPAPPDLAARRAGLAAAAASGVWATDPPPREVWIDGVRALRFEPPGRSRGLIIHLHGGAFRLGAPEAVGPFAAMLAKRCGVTLVCPAYRLAPEYPFPAGLIDAYKVLTALRASTDDPLLLSGDSAGGGLAASLTALGVAAQARVAGLLLLSAWLDLTLTNEDFEQNALTDPLFSRASATEAAALYLQGASPDDPRASPLLAQVAGFPPTFVSFGEGEVLAGDSRLFQRALAQANIEVSAYPVAGMEHVAVTRDLKLTGAAETFEAAAAFIDRVLADFPSSAGV